MSAHIRGIMEAVGDDSEMGAGHLPPAPPLTIVATGTSSGARWEIRAGGTPEWCLTVLEIELSDGTRTGGGGLGGPPLPAGRRMNLALHRSESGVRYLVGRVDPCVEHVQLELAGEPHTERAVRPAGASAELGVAFVAEVLPADADVLGMTAWDRAGNRVDAQQTAQHSRFLRGTGA